MLAALQCVGQPGLKSYVQQLVEKNKNDLHMGPNQRLKYLLN